MKTCSKCGAQVADDAVFCTVCGFNFGAAAEQHSLRAHLSPSPSLSLSTSRQHP